MRRREFITLIGGAAAWPLSARAQQPAMPVIGFLNAQSPDGYAEPLRAFRQGLKEAGYVEGENVRIEYRWAENQTDRLPALATDLARRQLAVIAATGGPPAVNAAKAATNTIPVVFITAEDPVRLGWVASLARPGGNLTGINFFTAEVTAKRLELLRELVPTAVRVALLVDPTSGTVADSAVRDAQAAAPTIGLQINVHGASTGREISAVFAAFAQKRPDVLMVGPGSFLLDRRVQLAHQVTRLGVPAIFPARDFAAVGGLMSYGASLTDTYRQIGVYVGRVLKGAKPVDMPVVQATKFDLVINAEAARILGLDIPATLLARADEVIE
jgi:putative tryptophan/tyrosine transport system substrate-binding protein